MALNQEQSDWVAALVPSGGAKGAVEGRSDLARARLDRKREVLEQALGEIRKIEPELVEDSKAFGLMTVKGEELRLLTGELDPDKEIDTEEDSKAGATLIGGERFPKLLKHMSVIVAQQEVLREAAMTPEGALSKDGKGEKLFSDGEVADEIWTPLVRAGVLPENLVQKRWSEVAKTFAGAREEYDRRLKAFSEAKGGTGELKGALGVFGLTGEAITAAGKIGGSAVDGIAALNQLDAAEKEKWKATATFLAGSLTLAKTLAEQVGTGWDGDKLVKSVVGAVGGALGVSGLGDTTKAVLTKTMEAVVGGGKFALAVRAKGVEATLDSLAEGVAAGFESLGSFYGDPRYGVVGKGVVGVFKSGKALKALSSAYKEGGAAFVEACTALLKEAGALAAEVIKAQIETEEWREKQAETEQVAEGLKVKLEETQKGIEALTGQVLKEAVRANELDRVVNSAQLTALVAVAGEISVQWGLLLRCVARGGDPVAIGREIVGLLEKADERLSALDELRHSGALYVKEAREKSTGKKEEDEEEEDEEEEEEEEEPDDTDERVKGIMARLEEAGQGLDPAAALVVQAGAQAAGQSIVLDSGTFAAMLANDFDQAMVEGGDETQKARLALSKLEPLIEEAKKSAALLKCLDTFLTVSVGVGVALFKKMGPAASFKDFAAGAVKAVGRMRELATWQQNMADGRNAGASALVAAEFNRAGLEQKYFTEAWQTAALKALEGIGASLKVVVPMAGALEAGAKIVLTGRELVAKFYAESELKAAWSDYEAALREPDNRKKIRQALRSNATLAKYALAWAAVVGRNPLAKEAMRRCGLSDAVLADQETNARKVVEYLEAKFDRDPVVLKASPNPDVWWPGKPELTARNWIRFLKAAEDETDMQGGSAVLITQLLVRTDKALPAAEADPGNDGTVGLAREALDALIDALAAYDPLDKDGERHMSMRKYADVLGAHGELRRRGLPGRAGA